MMGDGELGTMGILEEDEEEEGEMMRFVWRRMREKGSRRQRFGSRRVMG